MTRRERIYQKYGGLCAYSGTPLESDWQIDHKHAVVRHPFTSKKLFPNYDTEENMLPVQKIINHYKHSYSLYELRNWLLGGLHIRIGKLPKNPKTLKSIKHKQYILKLASYFNITADKPFSGEFYFETIEKQNTAPPITETEPETF